MDRRAFVGMVLAGSAAIATGLNKGEAATLVGKRQDGKSDDKDELRFRWERLDNSIGSWWDGDCIELPKKRSSMTPKRL